MGGGGRVFRGMRRSSMPSLKPPPKKKLSSFSRLPPGLWSTAYHEDADRRSTLSMLSLFAEVWPGVPQHPVAANACGTVLGQSISPIGSKL